jgi:hypothetical protein
MSLYTTGLGGSCPGARQERRVEQRRALVRAFNVLGA